MNDRPKLPTASRTCGHCGHEIVVAALSPAWAREHVKTARCTRCLLEPDDTIEFIHGPIFGPLACQLCNQPLLASERRWGQTYCQPCANALGITRICDAPSLEVELDEIDIAGMTWDAAWTDEPQDGPFASLGDLSSARGPDIELAIQNAKCERHRVWFCDVCRPRPGA